MGWATASWVPRPRPRRQESPPVTAEGRARAPASGFSARPNSDQLLERPKLARYLPRDPVVRICDFGHVEIALRIDRDPVRREETAHLRAVRLGTHAGEDLPLRRHDRHARAKTRADVVRRDPREI